MTSTSEPIPCPTCGALTFRGVINVRVWTGDNGISRYYPNGDHAPVCEARVASNARNAAIEAEHAAAGALAQRQMATLTRYVRRVQPLVVADPTLTSRMSEAMDRVIASVR